MMHDGATAGIPSMYVLRTKYTGHPRTEKYRLCMGGASIRAGGFDAPTFRGKGDRGYNLGIIHISHIALITPLH